MQYQYAVKLEVADGEFMATCRDIPEFVAVGDDRDEALYNAVEALELALSIYVDNKQAFPAPSKAKRDEHMVAVPVLSAAKLGLFSAMLDQGVSKLALAKRLGVHPPQIDRLLDVSHASKIETIEHALSLLGRRIVLEVEEAA